MRCLKAQSRRRGVTLVELLIVLVLVGILASVTTLAARVIDHSTAIDPRTVIADSLQASAASGRTIVMRTMIHDQPAVATVWPNGRVDADSAYGIDPLTGRAIDAR